MKEPLVPRLRMIATLQRTGKMCLKGKPPGEHFQLVLYSFSVLGNLGTPPIHMKSYILWWSPKSVCSYRGRDWKDFLVWTRILWTGRKLQKDTQRATPSSTAQEEIVFIHMAATCGWRRHEWSECVHTYVSTPSSINDAYIILICFS